MGSAAMAIAGISSCTCPSMGSSGVTGGPTKASKVGTVGEILLAFAG